MFLDAMGPLGADVWTGDGRSIRCRLQAAHQQHALTSTDAVPVRDEMKLLPRAFAGIGKFNFQATQFLQTTTLMSQRVLTLPCFGERFFSWFWKDSFALAVF